MTERGRAEMLHLLGGVGGGILRHANRGGVVVREELLELANAFASRVLDPSRHAHVRARAVPAREALIGDVAREDVLEDVLRLPGDR